MQRRTRFLAGAIAAGALTLAALGSVFAQQAQPGYGPGYGMMGGYGPVSGQTQPAGPGAGSGYGPGYGPGMMGGGYGGGYGYGPGGMMGGYGPSQTQTASPLANVDDAKAAFQRYVDATGNSNLALDEVMQFQLNYYAIVKDTSTGQGAFELLANPSTGAVFREPGPDMMWNTQYGMGSGYGGYGPGYGPGRGMMGGSASQPQGQPTVDAAKAQQIAQQWLDQYQPGSGTEPPDAFPGYYTLHITKDGQITGMLSVNAYTGQVWYHTWHGAFVASTEVSGS